MADILKVGIPKGSLEEPTLALFAKSGWKISMRHRNYFPEVNDDELTVRLCRPQEVPPYVGDGELDEGSTWEAAMSAADTSRMIYRETVKGYNRIRRRTMNRIPALILGYPHIGEEIEPFADAFGVKKNTPAS